MWKKILNIFKKSYKTSEVFKTNGIPEYTFVKRPEIDEKLEDWFSLKNKVCLFLGYSKSGKTVYRKKWFNDKNIKPIVFRCNKDSDIQALYNQIISESNLPLKSKSTGTESQEFATSVGAKGASVSSKSVNSNSMEKQYPSGTIDVNYICNQLKDRSIAIVLEDYHLINKNFNSKFSEDLKHFIDESVMFLIIGIPSSPGRSFQNNPDLTGRAERILFDYLSNEQIKTLIKLGSEKLNINFNEQTINKIIENSMRNAFLVQSILYYLCELKNIKSTQVDPFSDFSPNDVDKACELLADYLHSEYQSIMEIILSGLRSQKEGKAYNQYEEIIKSIQQTSIEKLESGILHTEISKNTWSSFPPEFIHKFIKNKTYQSEISFRNSVQSQITAALNQISDNFKKASAREIILYNDKKLYLMDIVFKFYLKWKKDLLK